MSADIDIGAGTGPMVRLDVNLELSRGDEFLFSLTGEVDGDSAKAGEWSRINNKVALAVDEPFEIEFDLIATDANREVIVDVTAGQSIGTTTSDVWTLDDWIA